MPFTRLLLPTFGRPMIATPIMALSMSCSSTAFGGGSICASEQKEQSQHLSPECVLFPGRHSNDGLVDVLFLHRIWRRQYLRQSRRNNRHVCHEVFGALETPMQ